LNAQPSLVGSPRDGEFRLLAGGAWTAAQAHALEPLIDRVSPHSLPAVIDMTGVTAFDTYGAWLLEKLLRKHLARDASLTIVGLAPAYQKLLAELHGTVPRETPAPAPRPGGLVAPLADLGRRISALGHEVLPFFNMLGATALTLVRIARRPFAFRFTSLVHQLDRIGWQAVPIILLITFLIGCIIAQQGFFHFRKFGADMYVVDMVGVLVLREIGVLIVAIMVAGRSGSAYTAELGSMKMREEIDALKTMGLDPIEVLVLPRILALVIALPILTFLGSMAALYGGGLVAWAYGGMSPDIFISRLKDAISLTHFKVGMVKAPFMGLIIGLVACSEGMRVKGSAESLGAQTTMSVVKAIFLVIVLDGLFAIFFASIGM